MENALKSFSNKNLLEIDDFESGNMRNRFHEIADVLLNQSLLVVNANEYRICEIEFYAYSEAHQDPYTHRHPEQLEFGNWYFHQVKTKTGYSYKGGNYKGLDLTLGDGKSFVGVLIRSLESQSTGQRIDGPSLVVDEILKVFELDSVAAIGACKEFAVSLRLEASLECCEYFMGPRVGLKPTEGVDGCLGFLFLPFRYMTKPCKSKNGKALLFLHQASLYGFEKAAEKIGLRAAEAEKYMNWFNNGLKMNIGDVQFGNKIEEQCTYFGAHYAHINSSPTDEGTEVTVEQLHEMAVRAFKEGDREQLKYLCDLGVEACGSKGLGLEFLKLRGICHAQCGDLVRARHDLLSVLDVTPNDEVAFINYVTACLEAGDSKSALQAIKLCYPTFDGASKGMILDSIREAITVGTLKTEDLPEAAILDLAQFLKIKRAV